MRYIEHYDRLVARAKTRVLAGYSERHHVIPRCMGGTNGNDNLVHLTPEEHFVAHLLLAKIYGHPLLWYAVSMMRVSSFTNNKRTNKLYGWVKRNISLAKRNHMKEWHAANEHPMLGKKQSVEARVKISNTHQMQVGGSAVHRYTLDGNFIDTFPSLKYAAKAIGRSPQTVWAACQNTKRSAGGFRFSYAKSNISEHRHSSRKKFEMKSKSARGLHLNPWEILLRRNRPDLAEIWKMADVIGQMLRSGEDTKISSTLMLNPHIVRKVKNKMKSGWDPEKDPTWLVWKQSKTNV